MIDLSIYMDVSKAGMKQIRFIEKKHSMCYGWAGGEGVLEGNEAAKEIETLIHYIITEHILIWRSGRQRLIYQTSGSRLNKMPGWGREAGH